MISANQNRDSYSGEVELKLRIGTQQFELSEISPDCVTLRAGIDLAPVENAEIIMMVDDRETRWAVDLPSGASGESTDVAVVLRRQLP